jgi:DNA transformation protein and related proteins
MPDPQGTKLFVNLGASETPRRLKGFGHGVRKVQSAGRNQAVIIHTATGRHLLELENKFADVGFSAVPLPTSEIVAYSTEFGAIGGNAAENPNGPK